MRIEIREIELAVEVGVYEHERDRLQRIVLSISLLVSLGRAFITDELEDTLDYDKLEQGLREYVSATRYKLVEKLSYSILEYLFSYSESILEISLELKKPEAFTSGRGEIVLVCEGIREGKSFVIL